MKHTVLTVLLNVVTVLTVLAATTTAPETPEKFAERTGWWREAKFGMFIHWGLYSIPADCTKKDGTPFIAEWYFANKEMQVADYEKFAARFNPVKFDARNWVKTARDAGMKYIVITTKHHDGFCLWDSKLTDYCVTKATPWQRDPLHELADECRRQKVRLCFYHSLMDWHHPDYLPRRKWDTRPTDGADLNRYLDYMKGQLRELLTGYGPIGILWWDGGWELDQRADWTPEIERRMRPIEVNSFAHSLQPGILINDRNCLPEDYSTPEQSVPATAFLDGRLWETCMTMNETWGYATNDPNWKSSAEMIRKLCDIAHKGGNFLLNVGPTPLGEFPPESAESLRDIGAWLKRNSDAIYGTSKSPIRTLPFDGRCTVKGDRLYVHVFQWPMGMVEVPGLQNHVRSARVLATRQKLAMEFGSIDGHPGVQAIRIARPRKLDPVATVIELRLDGAPKVVDLSPALKPGTDGILRLTARDAQINGTVGVMRLAFDAAGGQLTNWWKPKDFPLWPVQVPASQRYRVELDYACSAGEAGSDASFGDEGGQRVNFRVQPTGLETDFKRVALGEIHLPAGRHMLTLRVIRRAKESVMNFRELTLERAQ